MSHTAPPRHYGSVSIDEGATGEAEFRTWYERTSPRLYAYVRRYCADADCDDVIAEVYLIAWTRLAELPADALPWLIGTARNVLANSWRARGRRRELTAQLADLHAVAAPDCAGPAVERTDLLRAIGRLTASDQEVLLLAGWDGLDSTALATVLGCSSVTARARLSRARRRLADRLDGTAHGSASLSRLIPEVN